jgi:hypothetical protein
MPRVMSYKCVAPQRKTARSGVRMGGVWTDQPSTTPPDVTLVQPAMSRGAGRAWSPRRTRGATASRTTTTSDSTPVFACERRIRGTTDCATTATL